MYIYQYAVADVIQHHRGAGIQQAVANVIQHDRGSVIQHFVAI